MSITRAQIARQLLAEGGVSLNDAQTMAPDGEFLAYINPKEAGILKAMGGSGRMTPMGIPSFTEDEEDTGDVSNPGGGSTGGSGGGNTGDDQEDDNARMMQAMGLTGPGFTNRGGGDDPPSFFDRVKSAITRFNPTRFSPTGIIARGLGNLFNRLGNLRGFNPDGTRRTQKQFEDARRERQIQNRISNIMGRDAPFTDLTLDRLADLYSVLGQNVPGNINESLIGTTNKMRTINDPVSVPVTEGTMFDAEDDLGIVSQARGNPTFRDAMAQLNLERGVPRDQVFLSAKDFIDQSKTISSEDLGTIQSRMATSAGVPESAIQLTKTFNTPEELMSLGATEKGRVYGYNLTDQGKALDKFRKDATGMNNPKNENFAPYKGLGAQFQLNQLLQNENTNVKENKDFIQDAINKGFLAEPSDFINQKPFEDIF